jgi:hypothetical protein
VRLWKSEQYIVEGRLGNAKSFAVNHMVQTNLEGIVCTTIKERRHVPYTVMDKHSYKMTFRSTDENRCKGCVSKSRMRENRLSGSVGGLLNFYTYSEEGGLP